MKPTDGDTEVRAQAIRDVIAWLREVPTISKWAQGDEIAAAFIANVIENHFATDLSKAGEPK